MDIYNGFNLVMPYGPVSAKVNNKVESLDFRVYYNKDIEFLDITSSSGMRTYVRSLFFVLVKAVEELYPQGNISLEHPISKGYFCKLHIDRTIGLDDVQRIKQKMQEIIAADIPYTRTECHTEKVVRLFEERGDAGQGTVAGYLRAALLLLLPAGRYGGLLLQQPGTEHGIHPLVRHREILRRTVAAHSQPGESDQAGRGSETGKNAGSVSGIPSLEPDSGHQHGRRPERGLQRRSCHRPDKCVGGLARKKRLPR